MDKPTQLSAERQKLLAQRLKGAGGVSRETRRIPNRAEGTPPPLSFAQHQVWVIDQVTPGNPAYNLPIAYRLRGALDLPALEHSFNEVIRRQEAWRTTFHEAQGEAVQVVHPECRIRIAVTDLNGLPPEQREARASALAAAEGVKPFDLRQLPLVRVSIFRLAAEDQVLLVTFHHIVGDGLSLNLLFEELHAHYLAATSRPAPVLPGLPVQYADFAAWERSEVSGGRHAEQLRYWQRQLAGDLPTLELPTDRPRPRQQSFDGSTINCALPGDLVQALTAIATREGTTLFAVFLAALQTLLLRYTRREETIIATPVSSRSVDDLQPLIGNFINTVALRDDLAGDPTFIELLGKCRSTVLDALAHKDVPFETVLEHLAIRRDPSRNPVFQALLQVLPAVQAKLGDLSVSSFDFDLRFAQMDLALHLYAQPDGAYVARFQYCTDLFAAETIARLSRSFVRLLAEIVRDPRQRISAIPILTDAETNQLVHEWNQTAVEYPADTLLHELVERQAARTPDAVAVEFGDLHLTWRQLDRRANHLTHRLRVGGVGPNVLVGICVERSLEMVIGLLGILKAGGAYVPIDPDYPRERRAFMLDDAAVPVLLTQSKLLADLPTHRALVLCLDADGMRDESDAAPASGVTAGDLAYMIYTSGSTGRPKGALNHHRGIVNRLRWMQDRYRLAAGDAVLQKTPFSFDVSVWEFFWPLLAGARLVVAAPGGHQDPTYLVRTIQDRRITVLHFVPPMLRAFLDQAGVENCDTLHHVICSGEALPHELQEQFFARLSCELHNLYGPTEAAVDVTHWTCQRGGEATLVPIGRPVANTRCYILDPRLQPVPIGVAGELHLGGVQVGAGYHQRPELTAGKFIDDPFSTEPGARLYKTGDLCRYLPDGNIDYLGRMDDQVKIRGFRVELGEIETTLEQHPAVRQAVVIMREDSPNERRIVAYLVSPAPAKPSLAALRSHLLERLPDYMAPAAFVWLDAIPLSANGKVDRKALPLPDANRDEQAEDFAAPETVIEREICLAWEEALKVNRVGLHDNFFELGGDSLLGLRIVNRLREKFGDAISLGAIFKAPTVRALADAVAAAATGPSSTSHAEDSIKPLARPGRTNPALKI